jgi:hypothetical protein
MDKNVSRWTEAVSSRSAIFNSTNVHSFTADIIYGYEPDFDDISFVFSALSACPNIRTFSLKITYEGDAFGGFTPNAFDFLSHPNIQFPPLEILKLSSYDFDERSDGGYVWSYNDGQDWLAMQDEWWSYGHPSDNNPPTPVRPEWDNRTNLDAWKDAIDFSHIHTLELAWQSATAQTLKGLNASVLPSLKHLTLKQRSSYEDLEAILDILNTTANPLETLNLHNIDFQLADIKSLLIVMTSHHCSTLTSFSMTTSTSTQHFTTPQLTRLLKHCTEIASLDIAFPRYSYALDPFLKFEPFTPLL